jgi:hypothetical protein
MLLLHYDCCFLVESVYCYFYSEIKTQLCGHFHSFASIG